MKKNLSRHIEIAASNEEVVDPYVEPAHFLTSFTLRTMKERALDPDVHTVAVDLATQVMQQGAGAVVLAGSWVRGDAHPESDVDLYALGDGPTYTLLRRDPYLISLSYRTVEAVRAAFHSPREAGSVVPGWREALILADPQGLAQGLQGEARGWTWDVIGEERCNAYVAEEITGWAEEVHRLVVALERRAFLTAAAQRSLLAVGLPIRITVHLRLLYGSENVAWDLVGGRMGEEWRQAQQQALGTGGEPFEVTCHAALRLYALAAAEVHELLDAEQLVVVSHACRVAGFPQSLAGSTPHAYNRPG